MLNLNDISAHNIVSAGGFHLQVGHPLEYPGNSSFRSLSHVFPETSDQMVADDWGGGY